LENIDIEYTTGYGYDQLIEQKEKSLSSLIKVFEKLHRLEMLKKRLSDDISYNKTLHSRQFSKIILARLGDKEQIPFVKNIISSPIHKTRQIFYYAISSIPAIPDESLIEELVKISFNASPDMMKYASKLLIQIGKKSAMLNKTVCNAIISEYNNEAKTDKVRAAEILSYHSSILAELGAVKQISSFPEIIRKSTNFRERYFLTIVHNIVFAKNLIGAVEGTILDIFCNEYNKNFMPLSFLRFMLPTNITLSDNLPIFLDSKLVSVDKKFHDPASLLIILLVSNGLCFDVDNSALKIVDAETYLNSRK
jgi:hypothetical protein